MHIGSIALIVFLVLFEGSTTTLACKNRSLGTQNLVKYEGCAGITFRPIQSIEVCSNEPIFADSWGSQKIDLDLEGGKNFQVIKVVLMKTLKESKRYDIYTAELAESKSGKTVGWIRRPINIASGSCRF